MTYLENLARKQDVKEKIGNSIITIINNANIVGDFGNNFVIDFNDDFDFVLFCDWIDDEISILLSFVLITLLATYFVHKN